jgi:hypothetical protein
MEDQQAESIGVAHASLGDVDSVADLRETEARVQVAASMATLIAVACQKRSIAANGRFLIHNAWTVTQGDADDHEKAAQTLRDCEAEAARFYAARTGQTEDAMRALMDEERWLTPAEAKELGFVQEIDDPFDTAEVASVRAQWARQSAGKQLRVRMSLIGVQMDTKFVLHLPKKRVL